MRLRTFIAADMPAAMELVREQLGPDAVILSSQPDQANGRVKVTAALEDPSLDAALWQNEAEELDILDSVSRALDFHRVPAGLADRLISAASDLAGGDGLLALAGALEQILTFHAPLQLGNSHPVMLVGPPGCGKSATAAKLCAQSRLAGQDSRLVTMDTLKAGALAQATAFAEALGVQLDQAADVAALERLTREDPSGNPTVIDTAACNPLDRTELKRLADAAQAAGAELILVMAAGGDVLESAECALAFMEAGASSMITTRLDATRRLGAVLSVADVGHLGLSAAGVSPSIGDGLIEIDPLALARLIMPDAARQAVPATLATGTR